MTLNDTVNVLLVDDQPAKLLAYEVILQELGENLIKTASAREAFEYLLKNDVAVVLLDVCMPELDGFQFAAMIHEHPRFQKTAIIFISAIHLTDIDRLRGYEMGAVDTFRFPLCRSFCAPRSSLCGAISQDPPARTIESRTGTQGGGSNRGVEIIGDAATSK